MDENLIIPGDINVLYQNSSNTGKASYLKAGWINKFIKKSLRIIHILI